jgi:putative PIN family toxin of toxin-antitoxin system
MIRSDVFIDSSVLFAASLSAHGYARDLLRAGIRQHIALYVSAFVLDETERNLTRKAPTGLIGLREVIESHILEIIEPDAATVQMVAKEFEPKDAAIIAGAIEAKAHYLATFDRKHLLAEAERIQARFGIVVCVPERVLADLM